MASVDEKLLAQNEGSADRAGELRRAKKGNEVDDSSYQDNNQNLQKIDLFNQRRQLQKNNKNKKKKKEKKGLTSKLKISLAQLLRVSWQTLIKSFGLTLIWINIHWIFNKVFGSKIFCELGEEWFLRPGIENSAAKQKMAKEGGKKINLIETMGCACLNILLLFIIILFLAIVVLLLEILGDPIGLIKIIGRAVLGVAWDAIKGFIGISSS